MIEELAWGAEPFGFATEFNKFLQSEDGPSLGWEDGEYESEVLADSRSEPYSSSSSSLANWEWDSIPLGESKG